MIEVRNLSYSVGEKKILDNISFHANKGEMLAVIGPNGAGKTTLLKLLCRDLKINNGHIFLNDKNMSSYSLKALAKKRAVLTQHNTVSLAFLVKELVLMGRYPYFTNHPSSQDMQIVGLAMQQVSIAHLADRQYHTLSGGEQQRVQLARVLTQIYDQPDSCLLLDEPTNSLDLLCQQQILQLARKMADKGHCVISILHDINAASRYADKILMLKQGRLSAFGSPEEVINCENVHETFNVKVKLMNGQGFQCPLVIPGDFVDCL